MGVAPSFGYQRGCTGYFGIGQTNEVHNSPQFPFRVFEKEIVMSNKPLLLADRFNHALAVDFPKPQTKRVRRSVPLPHRVRDFKRITHNDDRFQPGQELPPKRKRQTVARILPAPNACRGKSFDQHLCFHPQRIKLRSCEVLVSFWRQIPGAAKFIQQFVVQRHKPQMFPETLGVISLGRHQFALWAQVKPASMQEPREHRRA